MGDDVALERQQHAFFVMGMIPKLQRGMIGQDTGQPWFLYWMTNALESSNLEMEGPMKLPADYKSRMCSYLRQCYNPKQGGFGGAPGIESHLASTYAAMLTIVNIGTKEAYDIVDREKMLDYLISLKNNTD